MPPVHVAVSSSGVTEEVEGSATTQNPLQAGVDAEEAPSLEETPSPFAGKLAPLGCMACALGCMVGLVVVMILVGRQTSIRDLNAFVEDVSAMANNDNDPHSVDTAQSCAVATGSTLRTLSTCDAEPWCRQLRQTAEISHAEIATLSRDRDAWAEPLMVNALDYRYFDSCHITGSVNLWGALLYCELRATERAHLKASSGGDGVIARNSLVALEEATRGRSLHEPLHNLTASLASGRPAVFYCANPS